MKGRRSPLEALLSEMPLRGEKNTLPRNCRIEYKQDSVMETLNDHADWISDSCKAQHKEKTDRKVEDEDNEFVESFLEIPNNTQQSKLYKCNKTTHHNNRNTFIGDYQVRFRSQNSLDCRPIAPYSRYLEQHIGMYGSLLKTGLYEYSHRNFNGPKDTHNCNRCTSIATGDKDVPKIIKEDYASSIAALYPYQYYPSKDEIPRDRQVLKQLLAGLMCPVIHHITWIRICLYVSVHLSVAMLSDVSYSNECRTKKSFSV